MFRELQARISEIRRADRAAFDAYRRGPNFKPGSLNIPVEALNAITRTRKALFVANSPEAVEARILTVSENYLRFMVVEKMPMPMSDPDEAYSFLTGKLKNLIGVQDEDIPVTHGLDEMLVNFPSEHLLGNVRTTDLILQYVHLLRKTIVFNGKTLPVLEVYAYVDRRDQTYNDFDVEERNPLRHAFPRVGRYGFAFYRGLPKKARDLGFRLIAGVNDPNNRSFFEERLGRVRVTRLPQELFPQFDQNHPLMYDPEYLTVNVLTPDLREQN